MAGFPTTLYRRGTELHTPVVADLEEIIAQDPTIRSQYDGGYVQTRARFTNIKRRWNVHYTMMSQTNKNTIRTFEAARKVGAESFSWTNPENGNSYTVRFLEPVVYRPINNMGYLYWDITFILEQV